MGATKIDMSKFDPDNMRISEAAAYLGIALGTFYNMRYSEAGPKFRKGVGGVRYSKKDLDLWKQQNTFDPER